MSANVVSLFSRLRHVRDWGQQEVAEFFRVRNVLAKSGIALDTDQGLSDEGDPWFVFCRSDNGEVVVHFARIDDLYVIGIPALGDRVLRGLNFRSLIDSFLSGQTDVVVIPQPSDKVRRLLIHPNALMVAFVATILLLSDGLKGSAEATESIADKAVVPSSSSGLPFFDWAHYQRFMNRDGGWESDRTLAIVAAVVMASIVANDFNLFDKAGTTFDAGRLTILGAAGDQAGVAEDALASMSVDFRSSQTLTMLDSPQIDYPVAHPGGALAKLAEGEVEQAKMQSTESNVIIELLGVDDAMGLHVLENDTGVVHQVLHFLGSMAESSPESAYHVYGLALNLIRDLLDFRGNLPMEMAPEQLVSLLNGVIQSADFHDVDMVGAPSSYMLDKGALVIEISGPSTVDTAALFIPDSTAPISLANTTGVAVTISGVTSGSATNDAAPPVTPTFTDDLSGEGISVASMNAPVIEIDSMSSIMGALRSFLAVAQDVDVVVDHDTIVFVDRSDKDDGSALHVGSVWKMQNDVTVMIVGSTETIHAYHEGMIPIA